MFLFLQWMDSKLLVSGTLFIKNPPLLSYNFLNFLYNKIYPLLSDIEIRDILLSLRVCFKPTMLWNLGFTVCNPPGCMQMTVLLNLYGRRIQLLKAVWTVHTNMIRSLLRSQHCLIALWIMRNDSTKRCWPIGGDQCTLVSREHFTFIPKTKL